MADLTLRRARRRERTARERLAAARRYAAMGWPVCPGAHPLDGGGRACSCDRVGCPAPGAHPVSPAWQLQASTDPAAVGRWWAAAPRANVILVTGRAFDVLDVPAGPGLDALGHLERAGRAPGPVAVAGERALFFVASRAAHTTEDEWWSCHLDCVPGEVPGDLPGELPGDLADAAGLRWHCRGSYVLAPPSRTGAGPAARWICQPDGRPLPDAVRLLEHLA